MEFSFLPPPPRMEKTIQDEARWCESNNAKIIYSIDSEKESRRRNRGGGRGERKKVSDALNCATINLPIRKTDELFVNNGVTSIYLWAPPSCKGIYNDNHRRRRRLDRTERGKQFDPAALMQVLMIADIEREREESVVFEIISSGRRIVPSFY